MADEKGRRKDVRVKARVKVKFKDAKAFITEYTHNISKGGLFVRSPNPVKRGSTVEVSIFLPGDEKEVIVLGEVIHVREPEKADESHPPGMGIELQKIDPRDRARVEKYISSRLKDPEMAAKLGRRKHIRREAKLRVKFGSMDALIEEYTQNISHGGIFIRTEKPRKLHEKLTIILVHPDTAEEIILDGEVVRIVTKKEKSKFEHPTGMGIKFLDLDDYTKEQLEAFINSSAVERNKEVDIV